MQKKVHILLLLCMAFFMMCATMEMSEKFVISHSVVVEWDDIQDNEAFFISESPFFFFTSEYIVPLSPVAEMNSEIPEVKCMGAYALLFRLFHFCESNNVFSLLKERLHPCICMDKDYYVLALRHIVV